MKLDSSGVTCNPLHLCINGLNDLNKVNALILMLQLNITLKIEIYLHEKVFRKMIQEYHAWKEVELSKTQPKEEKFDELIVKVFLK